MSEHDLLCPVAAQPRAIPAFCRCDEFAKVRADEDERIAQAIEALPVLIVDTRFNPDNEPRCEHAVLQAEAARIARSGGRDE